MQFAQLLPEHNAYAGDMQGAYALPMEKESSHRQQRRRSRLAALFRDVAKAADVAQEVGTPASYFSAILAGKRGLGDSVAAKIERAYDLGEGWFDKDDETRAWPFSAELWEMVRALEASDLERVEGVMRAHLGIQPISATKKDYVELVVKQPLRKQFRKKSG